MTRFSLSYLRSVWHRVPGWLCGAMIAATLYTISAVSSFLIGSTPLSILFAAMLPVMASLVGPFLASPDGVLEGIPIIITAILGGVVFTVAGALIGAGKGGWVIVALFAYSLCTLLYGIYWFLTQPLRLF